MYIKPISHRTRLTIRFQYGTIGYTRVDWYKYWVPTVPVDLLARVRLEYNTSSTNKARMYSVKQGLSRFEHDLHTILYDCLTVLSTV